MMGTTAEWRWRCRLLPTSRFRLGREGEKRKGRSWEWGIPMGGKNPLVLVYQGRQRDQLHRERTKRAVAVQCPCDFALPLSKRQRESACYCSMPFSPFIRVRSRETQCASNKNATTINLEPYFLLIILFSETALCSADLPAHVPYCRYCIIPPNNPTSHFSFSGTFCTP